MRKSVSSIALIALIGVAITMQGCGRGSVPKGMVLVPAGTFMMGGTMYDREQPIHQVTISKPFYMGKYEVTQTEWEKVMGSNPSHYNGDENLPVETVSWEDVIQYCNKLSLAERLTPCYSGEGSSILCDFSANGYRLPTEAEWEWAARGAGNGSLDYEFSGSNNADDVGWNSGNSGGMTHPVGTKLPNKLGLYDMSGNVWEWCWDWYESYSSASQTDPAGSVSGTSRLLRGGGAESLTVYTRSAYRDYYTPISRHGIFGFRVVRSL